MRWLRWNLDRVLRVIGVVLIAESFSLDRWHRIMLIAGLLLFFDEGNQREPSRIA